MAAFRIFLYVVIWIWAIAGETAKSAPPNLPDHLSFQQVHLSDNKNVFFVRAPLEFFDVRVLSPLVQFSAQTRAGDPERAARGYFLQDYLRRFDAIAILSGGYIDTYSPPTALGFVKSDGNILSKEHTTWLTEGVFCSDSGRAIIETVGASADRPKFRDCLQAGPLILSKGKPPTDLPSRKSSGFQKLSASVQEQCFVCLDTNQQVLIGVADKMDLPTLTAALSRTEIGCVNALRLTGQDTAGLRLRDGLFGSDDYLFPSAVGIFRRNSERLP
jgi:hypothetical protein